ncbi:unannotated protein [freshwater metagenome]|uniref:Unannotated protein n=1 Tax=freshwater metagenome TaxID=449393 RepID=A0A6J7R040_9ZZZZ
MTSSATPGVHAKGPLMNGEFHGRTAIVTGAASGIGRAASLALAAQGANVVLTDVNADALDAVATSISESGGAALAVVANVAKHEDVKNVVDQAMGRFGALHLAFNNAGIGGPLGPTHEIDIEAYLTLMDINLHSVFYGMRYQVPAIIASGGGAIVNTSSILGTVGDANAVAYVAAKHGVAGMTKAAALDYAAQGVRINSVHPGYVDTPLLKNLPDGAYEGLVGLHPMGRLGTPSDIAETVLFLLSDRAAFITGAQFSVDGGYTAH